MIENLLEEIPKELIQGKPIKLGNFGSFCLSLSSEGTDTQEKFNVKSQSDFYA